MGPLASLLFGVGGLAFVLVFNYDIGNIELASGIWFGLAVIAGALMQRPGAAPFHAPAVLLLVILFAIPFDYGDRYSNSDSFLVWAATWYIGMVCLAGLAVGYGARRGLARIRAD